MTRPETQEEAEKRLQEPRSRSLLAKREHALLHIGCGVERLKGWINIDLQPLASVDFVADVTANLPFRNARAIFAEHFLEHLRIDRAIVFLLNAHRSLEPGGWMRLSTPNVEWILATHYSLSSGADQKIREVLMLNRAFHAWGHQFLWNKPALEAALAATGFQNICWCRYRESAHKLFRDLERHQTNADSEELPHVLIAEAQKGSQSTQALERARDVVWEEYLKFLDPKVPKAEFDQLLLS
jgi:predicted SAM-dependent methyltransferase